MGPAQGNEPIRRRYGNLARADDRPVFATRPRRLPEGGTE